MIIASEVAPDRRAIVLVDSYHAKRNPSLSGKLLVDGIGRYQANRSVFAP